MEEVGRQRQRTGSARRVYKCEHHRRRKICKDCRGASICQHNRQSAVKCKEDCEGRQHL